MGKALFMMLFIVAGTNSYAQNEMQAELINYLNQLRVQAKEDNAQFSDFSAAKGKALYFQEFNSDRKPHTRSCKTCHNDHPSKKGKTRVGKTIKPLSPAVNSMRFTKIKKVKKWFKRNCKWTLGKECNAEQKGDFVYYLYDVSEA